MSPNSQRQYPTPAVPVFADRVCMRWPLFSMRKRPDGRPVVYTGREASFRISPSDKGVPTIWDRDIVIYITSQLLAKPTPSRVLSLCAHSLLKTTRRSTGVQGYQSLMNALYRLKLSRIATNIGQRDAATATVSWLDEYATVHRTCASGKSVMTGLTITLSEWAYGILLRGDAAPISADYFSLTGGLERRLYELVLERCAEGTDWVVPLRSLATEAGSEQCNLRRFKFDLRAIAARDALPGFAIDIMDTDADCIVRFSRAPQHPYANSEMEA